MWKERAREAFKLALQLGGLCAITWGCHLVYPPLAFIVPGSAVLALGLYAEIR